MEKITFFVVCVFAAVFQKYEAQMSVPKVPTISTEASLPSLEDTSEELSISDRAELQIINLCTEVPTFYDELINSYSGENSVSAEGLQRIQEFESKLKSKTKELQEYVSEYDDRISSTDPDAKSIQKIMFSAVDDLVQSVNNINGELNTEINQTSESAFNAAQDRAQVIQKNLRPAIVRFQESCLLQTKDILKNILSDYEIILEI